MVKIVLRDDDVSYFTNPKDLELVYNDIDSFPISYAVVPHVTDLSTKGKCPETKGNTVPRFIGENDVLVNWLKGKLRKSECDVLMHGITHQYKFYDGKKYPEMQWRSGESNLLESLQHEKKCLERLLDYRINVFVAPSNVINDVCLKAVSKVFVCFSGIIPFRFNESFTFRNVCNYLKRWLFRIVYKMPYPGVLDYSDHKELNACVPVSAAYLKRMYYLCKKKGYPMVINVHYWDLRDNSDKRQMIIDFVKWAIEDGAIPTTFSDCIKD